MTPRRPSARGIGARARPLVASWPVRNERILVVAALMIHLGLVLWGAAKNSVTFDENFHLPAGVMIAARADFGVSPVNPPLIKTLFALPALAAGARLPDPTLVATHDQWRVGESFMRRNADHYYRVFFAARIVVALLSVALAALVWRFGRRLHGAAGGMLALAFYVFSAEALAHSGVATIDIGTALVLIASSYAFWRFTRTSRWRDAAGTWLAVGASALTRFSCVILGPILIGLALLLSFSRHLHRPWRVWLVVASLAPVALLALGIGYLGQVSFRPLSDRTFVSRTFLALQARLPDLRLPLPDSYVEGLDIQSLEGQGVTPWYLFGEIHRGRAWYYFPLALLFKWPLGFLAALAARIALATRRWARRRGEAFVLIPAMVVLAGGMFALQLYIGIRYLFPVVPLLCIWLGGLAPALERVPPRSRGAARRWAVVGLLLAGLQAAEVMAAAPWYLSFFNLPSGGPGGGYRLVNDSNVDWGQGLIALRDEMRRRGITRIHLAYHGTTDPAMYGIDYVPYIGGKAGPESDWIAISSYYYVGLWQRMTTRAGRTGSMRIDFRELWGAKPEAVIGGCMYLYRVPR